MTFFPLDRELFTSSLWLEGTPEERCLWIWLIANRDPRDGVVRHREVAIAAGARLPRDVVDCALARFEAPDPDSRTRDNEGRRIDRTADGFVRILNHDLYLNKDYSTPRWRRWKERQKEGQRVGQRSNVVGNDEHEHEHEQEQTEQRTCDAASPVAASRPRSRPRKVAGDGNGNGAGMATATANAWPARWTGILVDVWAPHGEVNAGQLGKVLKPLASRFLFADVEAALVSWLAGGRAGLGPAVFARQVGDLIAGRAAEPTRKDGLQERMVKETGAFLRGGR